MEDNMNVFFEIFESNPRQGPGNRESTERALKLIPPMNQPQILDIGCGAGIQTIDLAHLTSGKIIALDNHQPVLDALNGKIAAQNLTERVQTINASMLDLPFEEASFDLIWAEGSIFIIGFEKGLQYWRKYLKPGGYLALTEMSWFKDNPPSEIQHYIDEVYPVMNNQEDNLAIIRQQGFVETGHFIVPDSAWWDDFYTPMERRLDTFREKYAGDNDALLVVDGVQKEIDMFRKYSEWYGYVFYIAQRND